jgi:hypothetical protein
MRMCFFFFYFETFERNFAFCQVDLQRDSGFKFNRTSFSHDLRRIRMRRRKFGLYTKASIIQITQALFKVHGVIPLVAMVRMTTETSKPFVNIHYFLMPCKKENAKLSLLNGYLLLLTFAIFQVISIIPLFVHLYALVAEQFWSTFNDQSDSICVLTVANVALDFLNLFWFKKIVYRAVKNTKKLFKSQ